MLNGFLTLVTLCVLIGFSIWAFMKFKSFMDDHAVEVARERGTDPKKTRIRYNRKALCIIGYALLVWLIFTCFMFISPDAFWSYLAIPLTVIALLAIYYNSWRAEHLQAVAWTFLSVPFGIAIGLRVFWAIQHSMDFLGALFVCIAVALFIMILTFGLYKFGSYVKKCDAEKEETDENDYEEEEEEEEEPVRVHGRVY